MMIVFVQARDATVAMPQRVQRVEKIMRQLEAGDLKLRVRSLEVTIFRLLNPLLST